MSIIQSKEFYRNMKESDIPPWISGLSFYEQPEVVQQFWRVETDKLINGLYLGGTDGRVFIHPYLYWYLNFWKMNVDESKDIRKPKNPDLRDNEWFFTENLIRAENENKGLAMFGTRRFGKALWDKEKLRTPDGWKFMGDVCIGDILYNANGIETVVEDVFPQGTVELFVVEFEDGRTITCCKDHLWDVFEGSGSRKLLSTGSMISSPNKKFSIPIPDSIKGGNRMPLNGVLNPGAYGGMLASFVMGDIRNPEDFIFFDNSTNLLYENSTLPERQSFADAFMKYACGKESGYDEIDIRFYDRRVISFIGRMFWSLGYYYSCLGKKMIISKTKRRLNINSIRYKGIDYATCIEVNSPDHLFLTTNYIVTHNSAILSSFTGFNITMTDGLDHVISGMSTDDLHQIGSYLSFGLDNVPPFFYTSRPKDDWMKGVKIGARDTNNMFKLKASVSIVNMDPGKLKSLVKGAGFSVKTVIIDEIGKGDGSGFWNAIKIALDTIHGNRSVPIMTGTGGNAILSAFAQDLLSKPESEGLLVMDWDLLNRKANRKTWKERKWGLFVPGQMAHASHCVRDEIKLSEYLGVKGDKYLDKIKIQAVDFDKTTEKILAVRKKYEEDKNFKGLAAHKMGYPLDIDDCFLTSSKSPFPVDEALAHLSSLDSEGSPSILADVSLNGDGTLNIRESSKSLAEFPFEGGVIDAPVQIFEKPEGNNFSDYIYTCGLDFYKQAVSKGDSLGAFYVFKRMTRINDPFANRIVASVAARPSDMKTFCMTCEALQRGYGGVCLQEGADIRYQNYLSDKNMEYLMLADANELLGSFGKKGAQSNRLGLWPSVPNQELLMNAVVSYCWERVIVGYDSSGFPIEKCGVVRIPDRWLLKEIIEYKPGLNVDRIIAFAHALLLARHYDKLHMMPRSSTQKAYDDEYMENVKRQRSSISAFSKRKICPFSKNRGRR